MLFIFLLLLIILFYYPISFSSIIQFSSATLLLPILFYYPIYFSSIILLFTILLSYHLFFIPLFIFSYIFPIFSSQLGVGRGQNKPNQAPRTPFPSLLFALTLKSISQQALKTPTIPTILFSKLPITDEKELNKK